MKLSRRNKLAVMLGKNWTFFWLTCFVLLNGIPSLSAQTNPVRNISGFVFDAQTGEPLVAANVFIANSMMGDASDETGRFEITKVPYGTFQIVVSVIGYEVQKRRIQLDDAVGEISFRLKPKVLEAPEIEVSAESLGKWRENLKKFSELFLGTSRNAEDCTILNPEVLEFGDEKDGNPFTAMASEPLEIENRALGYNITLLLDKFSSERGEVKYVVYTRFEEMEHRNLLVEQQWRENRQRTYNGSLRHFLKALYLNRYERDGFLVKSMTSPSFNEKARRLEVVTREILLSKGEHASERRLHFPEVLAVTYVPELEEDAYIDFRLENDFSLVRTTRAIRTRAKEPVNQTSWLELEKAAVTIDNFGHLKDPLSVKMNGYWAWERIAEMLPWEYEGYLRNRPGTPIVFEMPNNSGPRIRHLTISTFLGFASSGPAGDIEALMIQRGYNQSAGRTYPFSVTGLDTESGASWLIEVHYLIRWSLGLGLVKSEIRMGATHGRQGSVEIDVNYSVTTTGIIATVQPLKMIRLGFGPAWHTPKSGSSRRIFNDAPKDTKVGYVGDVTLLLQITPSFFAELKTQYRHFGQIQVGPYYISSRLLGDDLPAAEANFNHWFFGLGFGFGL